MKAIETNYDGILFRSKLEARWAVLFKSAKIEYVYEPECFVLSCGKKYMPDFYLPEFDYFFEVKPNLDWLNDPYHTDRYENFDHALCVLSGNYPSNGQFYSFYCGGCSLVFIDFTNREFVKSKADIIKAINNDRPHVSRARNTRFWT